MIALKRPSGRDNDQLREIKFTPDISKYAEGSCMVEFGNTKVLCTATISESIPRWLRAKNHGWVTAEYGMLPRSTAERMDREAKRGQTGRTYEIQRLISRALRSVVNLDKISKQQIIVDCDVINADGGTRTASVCGGFVAMYRAMQNHFKYVPVNDIVAAVSCGIFYDQAIVDLDYFEDSSAQADTNFILTEKNQIVEISGAGEEKPFTEQQFNDMLTLAKKSVKKIVKLQKQALNL